MLNHTPRHKDRHSLRRGRSQWGTNGQGKEPERGAEIEAGNEGAEGKRLAGYQIPGLARSAFQGTITVKLAYHALGIALRPACQGLVVYTPGQGPPHLLFRHCVRKLGLTVAGSALLRVAARAYLAVAATHTG